MKKMWQELRQVLGGDAGEDLEDDQGAQYAAAALMIEMCEADLQTDPQELDNLAGRAEWRPILEKLRQSWAEWSEKAL